MNPQLNLAPGCVEVAFTLHYYLGGPIKAAEKDPDTTALARSAYQPRDWNESSISRFVSNRFLDDLTVASFSLDPAALASHLARPPGPGGFEIASPILMSMG